MSGRGFDNGQNRELDGWSTMQDLVLAHNEPTAKLHKLSKHFPLLMLDFFFLLSEFSSGKPGDFLVD